MHHKTRLLLLLSTILLIASQHAFAHAGQLDPTFGNGGIVTTDFGIQLSSANMASGNAVVIQPDGKIVVCGEAPGSNDFPVPALARYHSNGTLDTSFGTRGIVTTPSIEDVSFTSIALQSDGKIVAGAGGFNAYVVRYKSDGTLDSNFGTGGIVTLGFINGPSASGVLVQPDDKILFANHDLFRFLSDGQLDTSFGTGGTARTAGYPATGVALLPNGKILVASSEFASGFISQYDANGGLDASFGIGGQLATPGTASGLVLLENGNFLSGGTQTNNSIRQANGSAISAFAVSRYLPAGVTDASFGTNGGTVTGVPNYPVVTTSGLAVQSTGDIVTLGTANVSTTPVFALARYTASGELDPTFGTKGTVVTTFAQGASVSANGITIQPDGKIVAVGSYEIQVPRKGFDTALKVVRYLGH